MWLKKGYNVTVMHCIAAPNEYVQTSKASAFSRQNNIVRSRRNRNRIRIQIASRHNARHRAYTKLGHRQAEAVSHDVARETEIQTSQKCPASISETEVEPIVNERNPLENLGKVFKSLKSF